MIRSWIATRPPSRAAAVHPRLECDARRAVADQYAVADLHRLADLMGDEHRGLVVLPHQPDELRPQRARRHLVERREWFVAQQQIGLDRKRARDRDALTHAAGERVRIVVLVAAKSQAIEPAARPIRSALAGSVSRICRPSMTLASAVRHGISRSFWNTMPTLPRKKSNSRNGSWPITRTVPVVGSTSPAIRLKHRRLAAAGLAEHGDDLALGNVEIQSFDGNKVTAVGTAEHLGDVVKGDGGL